MSSWLRSFPILRRQPRSLSSVSGHPARWSCVCGWFMRSRLSLLTGMWGAPSVTTRAGFSATSRESSASALGDLRVTVRAFRWASPHGPFSPPAEKLVHAFMTSRLDYCNALLGGCPASSINKLQVVQNAVARVLTRSRKYDHITPILQSLHWLPIKLCISYKILLLAYKALNGFAPAYITSLLSRYNPSRSLRSQNSGLLVVPRIAKSTKAFSYLATKLWNSLPDNVWGSDTCSLFKSRLKTHLFSQAFT